MMGLELRLQQAAASHKDTSPSVLSSWFHMHENHPLPAIVINRFPER